MTSHARQDAREKAETLKGKSHGYGYGTTTSRHVRFDAKEKEVYEDCSTLVEWDDLCEYGSMPVSVLR